MLLSPQPTMFRSHSFLSWGTSFFHNPRALLTMKTLLMSSPLREKIRIAEEPLLTPGSLEQSLLKEERAARTEMWPVLRVRKGKILNVKIKMQSNLISEEVRVEGLAWWEWAVEAAESQGQAE